MRLAIVIPTGPRTDCLHRCLVSITQARIAHAEVIVVADTPADCESVVNQFPQVRLLRIPHQGFAASANVGIEATTADVVQLLNDDTEVEPDWATAALQAFANTQVGSVAPLVLQLATRGTGTARIDSAGDIYDRGGFARKRWHGQVWRAGGPCAQAGPVWGANATAGFYRRAALQAVGGFPNEFGSYFEDVDLAHRLNQAGYACHYEPKSIVWHQAHTSYGVRPSRQTLRMQSRNEERVFWRNTRRHELAHCLPRHAAVLCAKAVRRTTEGTLVPWLAGRWAAWCNPMGR